MMKKSFVLMVLCIVYSVLLLGLSGCTQPGETAAEGKRRHKRMVRINMQELNKDVDYLLHTDQPSGLTDKRIP
ncbi:hypothetical protein ACFL3G_03490 [Planctomycetota bacterium]